MAQISNDGVVPCNGYLCGFDSCECNTGCKQKAVSVSKIVNDVVDKVIQLFCYLDSLLLCM